MVGEIDEDLQTQFELSLSRERVEQARRDIISLHERFQSAIEQVPVFVRYSLFLDRSKIRIRH